MAACKEAYNQLKEQLDEERGQGEELRRHLQDRQHQLDEAYVTIVAQQQTEHRHSAELKAVKAEVQDERQISAELQVCVRHVITPGMMTASSKLLTRCSRP